MSRVESERIGRQGYGHVSLIGCPGSDCSVSREELNITVYLGLENSL